MVTIGEKKKLIRDLIESDRFHWLMAGKLIEIRGEEGDIVLIEGDGSENIPEDSKAMVIFYLQSPQGQASLSEGNSLEDDDYAESRYRSPKELSDDDPSGRGR